MVGTLILLIVVARAESPMRLDADADDLVQRAEWCATAPPWLLPTTRWCSAIPDDCVAMRAWCAEVALGPTPPGSPNAIGTPGSSPARAPAEPGAAVPWLGPALLALLAAGVAWVLLAAWREQGAGPDDVASADTPEPGPDDREDAVVNVLPVTALPLELTLLRLRKAGLLALARAGLLSLEPGLTDREYLRALRPGREASDLGVLVGAIELIRYARRPVPGPLADAAVQAGERLARSSP